MKAILVACFLCLVVGCEPQKGMVDFVDVVHDHKILTNETSKALILSIMDDLQEMRNSGIATPETEAAVAELRDRLTYMSRQSDIIEEYVNANNITDELLAKLLQSKWKGR